MTSPDGQPIRALRFFRNRVALVAVAATLTLLVLVPVSIVLLHSVPGRALVASALEAWGSRATGGRLRIGELELKLLQGQAGMRGVSFEAPGLALDVERVDLAWTKAQGPALAVLRPVAVVELAALAPPPAGPASGLAAQPWLALETLARAQVEDGQIEVRETPGKPRLVLRGLALTAPAGSRGPISLSVADASAGGIEAASGEFELRIEGGALLVERARVKAGWSVVELDGRLERVLPATASVTARGTFEPPAGRILADAEIHVTEDRVTGPLRATSAALSVAGLGPWVARVAGRFDGSRFDLESLEARGFGGRVEATGELALAPAGRSELRVRVEGIDPAALARAASGKALPLSTRATGTLRFTATGHDVTSTRGEGRITLTPAAGPGLRPAGEATLRSDGLALSIELGLEARGASLSGVAELANGGALSGRWHGELPLAALPGLAADLGRPFEAPPVEGGLRVEGELGGRLGSPTFSARLAGERLAADLLGGRVEADFRFDAASGALQLEARARALALERLPLPVAWGRGLTGLVSADVRLAGSPSAPRGELRLTLEEPRLGDVALPSVTFEARAERRVLQLTGTGTSREVFLRGTGALAGDFPMRLEIDLKPLGLEPLLAALPALREAEATLAPSGTLAVELPLGEPSRIRFSSADLAASGRVRGLEWRVPPFAISGDVESVRVEGLRLEAGPAWVAAQGRLGLAAAGPIELRVAGQLDLGALASAFEDASLSGTVGLELRVAGAREAPVLSGSLRAAGASGRALGVSWEALDLAARFDHHELEVETLRASLLGGRFMASGRFPLVRKAGAGASTLRFELQDVDLAPLVEAARPRPAGSASLFASLDGVVEMDSPSLEGLRGRGRLTRLEAVAPEGRLALPKPTAWRVAAGRLELDELRIESPHGGLAAAVEARLTAPQSLTAVVEGGIELSVLNPFVQGLTLGGQARVDARIGKDASGWTAGGAVRLEAGRFALSELRFAASDLHGELRLEGDRASLELRAATGDGRIHLKGGMQLGAAILGPVDLQLEGQDVPIGYPPGFRGRVTGTLRLAGDPGRYRLTGELGLSQGHFSGQLDARAQALDRLAWQLAALEGGLPDQVALDVTLRLSEPVRVRNSRLRLDTEGAVRASGSLAQPMLHGQVNLLDGGELTLGRTRVRITGGRIDLDGYPAGMPEVDFHGAARVSGIAMEIQARGPLDDLQLTLSSDRSELSQADLVTLMLTGRTASAAAAQGGVVVAEQLAMALGGVLQRGVGDTLLIDVSPERSLITDDSDPTQRFNIGTRVTQTVTVIYSAALDGTEKRWIVEFNPAGGRFRLRTITEEDNSLSLEATHRFAFDLWNRGRRGAPRARESERLAALRFEGELPVPEARLREAARLRVGRRASWLQREQAVDRVEERLVQDGHRGARVDGATQPVAGGVELVMRVDAGPLVTLTWTGDGLWRRARRDAEQAWLASATPDAAAAAVARAARWRLQSERYYTARVEPRLRHAEGRVDVELQVTRGPRGTGVDLVFEGNRVIAAAGLSAGLPSPGSHAFFEMLDERSSRIESEVRVAYAGIGHLQARVGAIRSAFLADSGRLQVTVPVTEGALSKVTAVELPAQAAAGSGPRLALEPGRPFDIAAYRSDRELLGAWFRDQGYIEAQVRAQLEPQQTGGVLVRYHVDAGPRPRVGETRVAQTGRTRKSLIERSLTLREGDLVKADALAASRERLWDLGLFRFVDVRAEPRPDDEEIRDLQVSLIDRPDVQVEYGLRYTTAGEGGAAGGAPSDPESGVFQLAAAVELNSPFGFGGRLRGYATGTRDRNTWGVNLDAATILGRRIRTQLFVFDDRDDEVTISGFASRVRGVSLQQSRIVLRDRRSRRWHDRLRVQWGYTYKDIEYLESAPLSLSLQGNRGYLSLGAVGDERDSLTDPKRGVFWTANSDLARTGLGSDVDYLRFYGQLFTYLPIGRLVWAQGYRLGFVPGDEPLLLLENRFRAGGPTTVRGYAQNSLGALAPEAEAIGGQAVAIFNQELRFPLWRNLHGGAFWDAGNVWLTSGLLDLGDLRHSVGVGLRYIFPFGPLRVEYAWILGRQPGEPAGRFVFGLGHAF